MNSQIVANVKARGYLRGDETGQAILQAVKRLEELHEQLQMVEWPDARFAAMMTDLRTAAISARDLFRSPGMMYEARITDRDKFMMEGADQVVTLACEENLLGTCYETLALIKSAGDVERGVR